MDLKPKKVIILDQAESALYDLKQELNFSSKSSDFEVLIGDVTRKERIKKIFSTYQPEIVFHAAAYKHVPLMELNPTESIRTNVIGTKIIADCAAEYDVQKFILVSIKSFLKVVNIAKII